MSASSNACKRFVEKTSTRELLKEDGTWTINDAEAMEFDSLRSMIRTCLRLKVEDAKLLLRFDGSRTLNMRFQLPPRSAENLPKRSI